MENEVQTTEQENLGLDQTSDEKVSKQTKESRIIRFFKRIFRKKPLTDYTVDNDIKYRPPLSYRHLRIVGWFTLFIQLLFGLLAVGIRITRDEGLTPLSSTFSNISSAFSGFMAPLFLIAAFSVLLNAKDGYKKLFITYGGLSLVFIGAFYLIFYHYIARIASVIGITTDKLDSIYAVLSNTGFLIINFFIDLLLCTSFNFFINYKPVKFFQGKWLIAFRLFAILPVLYVLASLALKALASLSVIQLPIPVFPLLTSKPVMMFFLFVAMSFYIKRRERYFIKHGKTHEDYKEFLKTNANAFHFARHTAFMCVIFALLDIILCVIISTVVGKIKFGEVNTETVTVAFSLVQSWGFGGAATLILIAPFILLFNYTKTYKNNMVDIIIPVAGLSIIAFALFETTFQLVMFALSNM